MLGLVEGMLGTCWKYVGALLGRLGPFWGHAGAMFGHAGAMLELCWSQVGIYASSLQSVLPSALPLGSHKVFPDTLPHAIRRGRRIF